MKRILLSTAVLVLLLSSCAVHNATTPTAEPSARSGTASGIEDIILPLKERSFSTEKYRLMENNIYIEYPQISFAYTHEKTELETKINELLVDTAFSHIYDFTFENEETVIHTTYQITKADNELLSVVFTQFEYYPYAAHYARYRFTANISIETGERLSLSDVVRIPDDFVNSIRSYEISDHPEFFALQEALDEKLYDYTDDMLNKALNEFDTIDNYSYFTDEYVILVFWARMQVGGYLELAFSYDVFN